MSRRALACALVALCSCAWLSPEVGSSPAPAASGPSPLAAQVSFARDIRPLFDRGALDPMGPGCRDCHYPGTGNLSGLLEGGLDLSTLGALRAGGFTTRSAIVIAGDPQGSGLVQKLRGTWPSGARMPAMAGRYWTAAELALVEAWIAGGAAGEDGE
jgi:hypothetical protein